MNIPADIHARVVELTDRIIDAGQSGAADAAEAGYDELRRYCESLAAAGRDHPFLWETLADFTGDDRLAIALYLRALPQAAPAPPPAAAPRSRLAESGAKLYEQHCAQCHGEQGQGQGQAYPPLAGNRAVTLESVDNLLQAVLYGGFNAATAGYPRPFGMPPFLLTLSDQEVAATLSHIRTAWGNQASEVSTAQVHALRSRTSTAAQR